MTTAAPSAPSDVGQPDPIKAIPVRHPGRWVTIAIIALLGAMFVNSVLTNPNWQWGFQLENAFTPPVLRGVVTTLWLTVVAMLIGRRPRRRARGDAALAEPGALGGRVVLRLVLPRHAGAGPAGLLGQPRRAVPQLSLGIPFGPEFDHVRDATT